MVFEIIQIKECEKNKTNTTTSDISVCLNCENFFMCDKIKCVKLNEVKYKLYV